MKKIPASLGLIVLLFVSLTAFATAASNSDDAEASFYAGCDVDQTGINPRTGEKPGDDDEEESESESSSDEN